MKNQMKNRSIKTIIGCVLMTSASMSAYLTLSNYLYPISVAIGADISKLALIFTFASISNIIISLFLGKLMKAVKVRVLMIIASVSLVAFYACLAFSNSLVLILIGAFIFGIAAVLGAFGTALTVITWWAKPETMGRSITSVTIGMGILTFISSPIIAKCIASFGRITALYQGLICGALMLLSALFLISEHPSSYAEGTGQSETGTHVELPGLGLKTILKTAPFWALMLGTVLVNTAQTGFNNNAAMFYQTFGVDAVKASYGISIFSAAQLVWSFIFGMIVDKKGAGTATLIHGLIGAAAFVGGIFLTGFTGIISMAVFMSAICFGGNLGAMIFPQLYGQRESGTLIGYANAAGAVGAMLGAPIAAAIYSATGSLKTYLILATALVLVTIFIVMSASSKKTVEKMSALQK